MKVRCVNLLYTSQRNESGEREDGYLLVTEVFPSRTSWIKARSYHFYDMIVPCKIPGWFKFERWLLRHGAEDRYLAVGFMYDKPYPKERLRDKLYMWSVKQDLRCYDLSAKAVQVYRVSITKEQYLQLGYNDKFLDKKVKK